MEITNEIVLFRNITIFSINKEEQELLKTLLSRNGLINPNYDFYDYRVSELEATIEASMIDFRINGPSPGVDGHILYSLREKIGYIVSLTKSNVDYYRGLLERLSLIISQITGKYHNLYGLCFIVRTLINFIDYIDCYGLLYFIDHNRPKPRELFYDERFKNSCYYWELGNMEVRKEWLEYKIEQLKMVKK